MFVFRPRVPAKTAEGHEMPLLLSTETEGLGGCVFVCFFVFMSRQGKRGKKKRGSGGVGGKSGTCAVL